MSNLCVNTSCVERGDPALCGYCIHCWASVPAGKRQKLRDAEAEARPARTCARCGSTRLRAFCGNCGASQGVREPVNPVPEGWVARNHELVVYALGMTLAVAFTLILLLLGW